MPLKIDIVTFNANERAAVGTFLNDVASGAPSRWARHGDYEVSLNDQNGAPTGVVLRHVPLEAQGNVVAAVQLADAFAEVEKPDYVVFYGCAGAIDRDLVGEAFLIGGASYASLGTVKVPDGNPGGDERVTLKNKWLCHTDPHDVFPLQSVTFLEEWGLDLCGATSLTTAHVFATDKVIQIGRGAIPRPRRFGTPAPIYAKGDWTYGEALAYVAECVQPHTPVLVEMESYGIGRIAQALKVLDRVVIIRVVTDDLLGHAHSDVEQRAWLITGRIVLARLTRALVNAHLGV